MDSSTPLTASVTLPLRPAETSALSIELCQINRTEAKNMTMTRILSKICARFIATLLSAPVHIAFFKVQSFLASPQKNSATVPGPVWLPMVVPMLLITTFPDSFGNASSTRSATFFASS